MTQQNSIDKNFRMCFRATDKASLNGYRNEIFLPGIGSYKGTWKNNLRDGMYKGVTV